MGMGKKEAAAVEDLAIQCTLSMTVEERLELLAALIVDKIAEDQSCGEPLYRKIMVLPNV
jgi:hypothetical protein